MITIARHRKMTIKHTYGPAATPPGRQPFRTAHQNAYETFIEGQRGNGTTLSIYNINGPGPIDASDLYRKIHYLLASSRRPNAKRGWVVVVWRGLKIMTGS